MHVYDRTSSAWVQSLPYPSGVVPSPGQSITTAYNTKGSCVLFSGLYKVSAQLPACTLHSQYMGSSSACLCKHDSNTTSCKPSAAALHTFSAISVVLFCHVPAALCLLFAHSAGCKPASSACNVALWQIYTSYACLMPISQASAYTQADPCARKSL